MNLLSLVHRAFRNPKNYINYESDPEALLAYLPKVSRPDYEVDIIHRKDLWETYPQVRLIEFLHSDNDLLTALGARYVSDPGVIREFIISNDWEGRDHRIFRMCMLNDHRDKSESAYGEYLAACPNFLALFQEMYPEHQLAVNAPAHEPLLIT